MDDKIKEPMSDERLEQIEDRRTAMAAMGMNHIGATKPMLYLAECLEEIHRLRILERSVEELRDLEDRHADMAIKYRARITELEARVAQLTADREGLLPAWQKQRESLRSIIASLGAELSHERIDGQKWRDYCEAIR